MAGWLATGAVVYGGLVAGLYLFQRQLLYHPTTFVPDRGEAGVPDMTPVVLRTEDGLDLLAWHKAGAAGRKLVIFFHGNAGHIGHRGWKARHFLDAGNGLLLVSWRGFGGNAGRPSEAGLLRDSRAALAFATQVGMKPFEIVLYGESLGSSVAVQLAAELAAAGTPVGGIVLESPFTSIADVAQHHYFYIPARYLVADKFDSASRIGSINAPLLVVHGENDRTVPVRFGRELFERAKEPKKAVWLKADHNDLFENGALKSVLDFLGAPAR